MNNFSDLLSVSLQFFWKRQLIHFFFFQDGFSSSSRYFMRNEFSWYALWGLNYEKMSLLLFRAYFIFSFWNHLLFFCLGLHFLIFWLTTPLVIFLFLANFFSLALVTNFIRFLLHFESPKLYKYIYLYTYLFVYLLNFVFFYSLFTIISNNYFCLNKATLTKYILFTNEYFYC